MTTPTPRELELEVLLARIETDAVSWMTECQQARIQLSAMEERANSLEVERDAAASQCTEAESTFNDLRRVAQTAREERDAALASLAEAKEFWTHWCREAEQLRVKLKDSDYKLNRVSSQLEEARDVLLRIHQSRECPLANPYDLAKETLRRIQPDRKPGGGE